MKFRFSTILLVVFLFVACRLDKKSESTQNKEEKRKHSNRSK